MRGWLNKWGTRFRACLNIFRILRPSIMSWKSKTSIKEGLKVLISRGFITSRMADLLWERYLIQGRIHQDITGKKEHPGPSGQEWNEYTQGLQEAAWRNPFLITFKARTAGTIHQMYYTTIDSQLTFRETYISNPVVIIWTRQISTKCPRSKVSGNQPSRRR